jgi:LPXTG-site transpeptidase (sortase) family protein
MAVINIDKKKLKRVKKFIAKNYPLIATNTIFVAVLIIVIVLLSGSDKTSAIVTPLPKSAIQAEVSGVAPEKILIPSIGVDADIEDVGIARSGNMGVPEKYQNVGWYRYGPVPGEVGNAVIAGHLDRGKDSKPAVFYNLGKLRVGDYVYIVSEGKKLQFKVREIGLVDYYNPPLERIFGTTTKAMLNLITCDGTWIPEKKTYDERLVVYTEYVDAEDLP